MLLLDLQDSVNPSLDQEGLPWLWVDADQEISGTQCPITGLTQPHERARFLFGSVPSAATSRTDSDHLPPPLPLPAMPRICWRNLAMVSGSIGFASWA